MLFALANRLYGLDRPSLWLDEGFSVQIAALDRAHFFSLLLADVHPPLYYLLLLGWTSVFGTGEVALRTLSVVLGVLTVPLLFLIGRMLAGTRAGLVAAVLLATSPLHVQYSTEVRMYSLLMLVAALAIWGAVRFALAPGDARAVRQGAIGFAAGAILCPATQATGLFVLPPLSLLMLLGWLLAGRPRLAVRPFVVAHLAVGIFLAAWLPLLLSLALNVTDLANWIPRPSPLVVVEVVGSLLAQKLNELLPLILLGAVAAGLGAIALLGLWMWRRDPLRLGFALLVGGLPFALTVGISFLVQPVFLTRIHLWSLLPIYVLMAVALTALPWPRLRKGCVAFVALNILAGLYSYHHVWLRPDWRSAAQQLDARLAPGDLLLAPPPVGLDALLGYYVPSLRTRLTSVPNLEALPAIMIAAEGRTVWVLSAQWHDRVPPERVAGVLAERHRPDPPERYRGIALQRWTPVDAVR